jgi:hypothetical protein
MVHGTRQHAEALREEAAAVLAPLGLRLAEEKTRIVHIDEGFDFLGFTIRRMRKRGTSKHYVYTVPSKKAIQAVKDKIAVKTYRATQNQDLAALIQSVNKTLGVGELLPARRVQGRLQRCRLPRVGPHHALAAAQAPRTHRAGNARAAEALLRPRNLDIRSQRDQAHRRVSRAGHPLPLPRNADTDPVDTPPGDRRKLKPSGQGTRRARCAETRTPGSAGRPGKPTGSNPGTAGRPGLTQPRNVTATSATWPATTPPPSSTSALLHDRNTRK